MTDPTSEELADGFALWEERRPQSGEDWVEVAKRVLADPQGAPNASPLFSGLLLAQGRVAVLEGALREIVKWESGSMPYSGPKVIAEHALGESA